MFEPLRITDATPENLESPDYQVFLRRAIADHLVLVLEGYGHLSADEHLRMASIFGPIQDSIDRVDTPASESRLVQTIERNNPLVDAGSRRPSSYYWHTDRSFLSNPPYVTVLNMLHMPVSGGDTHFVDTRAAFQRMHERDKQRMRSCRARHSYSHYHCTLQADNFDPSQKDLAKKLNPDVWHPLIVNDRAGGSEAIYFSELCVNDLEFEDPEMSSAPTVAWVAQQFDFHDLVYRHSWHEGDVVIWNDLATMHRSESSNGYRRLRRVVVGLSQPIEWFESQRTVPHVF